MSKNIVLVLVYHRHKLLDLINSCLAKLREVHSLMYHIELLGFGLLPSSVIQENRKHDVSETGSVSILR
jgi:hypothetical protein